MFPPEPKEGSTLTLPAPVPPPVPVPVPVPLPFGPLSVPVPVPPVAVGAVPREVLLPFLPPHPYDPVIRKVIITSIISALLFMNILLVCYCQSLGSARAFVFRIPYPALEFLFNLRYFPAQNLLHISSG
ncbi:MAG: hypothetical protein E3J72_09825 [Planctomycetota bacterium]|nr:MAG: hypothetical protein E3J72_09825 [Planctomycetota bacterium]